jgi:uncharacterized protein (DUF1697 family)
MAELRLCLEEMGFTDVATYIQSGNALFAAPRRKRAELARSIESQLGERFGTELKIVLVSANELRAVVESAPQGFGGEDHLCDVIFLRKPLTVKRAISLIEPKEGVDEVWPGRGVLYFSRLAAKASSSRLAKMASRPEYREMTVRSWSTTTKLLGLIESRGGA